MANIITNIFTIPELRKRILFTIGMLIIFRLGAHVPVPGINAAELAQITKSSAGGLLGLVNMFSGGALLKFSLFGLGIMPYISASIIMQLLQVVIPHFERLAKEGEQGRKKIQQYTRFATIGIAALQAYGYTFILKNLATKAADPAMVYPVDSSLFIVGFVLSVTVGTVFLMWVGEQITERGIGNGISMLIFAGIIARLPQSIIQTISLVNSGVINPVALIILLAILMLVVGFVVIEQTGARKIPVQYAKRVVGRKIYGSQSTHIPFKINPSGVIPIIFASTVIMFPAQIAKFFQSSEIMAWIARALDPQVSWIYYVFYTLLVVFFAYFYTAITFNPNEIADNLKKHGGFIPGIRPGPNTATFLGKVLNRITLPGSIFLASIALFPSLVLLIPIFRSMPPSLVYLMGGTSLLIIVAVDLDVMKQIESHLLMRHYDGFMKKGKLRSGRSR
ncbi:MAG: preprotein translocase subunit SecY [Spirochaetes bacterium]|nr:preprotein translocase subunit SecY [Spirochaetota bacterium]MCK5266929.1 preprotein translocase subunit SecY [Spirochaetota bacterium]